MILLLLCVTLKHSKRIGVLASELGFEGKLLDSNLSCATKWFYNLGANYFTSQILSVLIYQMG